jgi:hypothetical protein
MTMALGYDATAEVAELKSQVAHLEGLVTLRQMERDEARTAATVAGLQAESLSHQAEGEHRLVEATRETLALVREWHADTRARLEKAEAPPIMVSLETTAKPDLDHLSRMRRVPNTPTSPRFATGSLEDVRFTLERMVADHGAKAVARTLFSVNRDAATWASVEDGPPAVTLPSVRQAMTDMTAVLVEAGEMTEDQAQSVNGVGETVRLLVAAYRKALARPSTPVEKPVDAYPMGARVEDGGGDVWMKMSASTQETGWWQPEDHDTRPMHQLSWITEGWGGITPLD